MNFENQLNSDGFVIFRDILDPSPGNDFISEKKVNYAMATDYIDNYMMREVNRVTGWDSVYTKYRISNNNNSTDASLFHRDIITNTNKSDLPPVFTCLTYFDKTTMELIPGSHKKLKMTHSDSCKMYMKKIQLSMNPGDVLVFYSTLLHRGIFTENLPNRRLIQVFEVFPSIDDFETYSDKIHHILGNDSYNEQMISFAKNKILNGIMNYYGYLNSSTGYGAVDYDYDYLSSESRCGRLDIEEGTFQDSNKYILRKPNRVIDTDEHNKIVYNMFYKKIIIYIIITFILTCFISYFIYNSVARKQV